MKMTVADRIKQIGLIQITEQRKSSYNHLIHQELSSVVCIVYFHIHAGGQELSSENRNNNKTKTKMGLVTKMRTQHETVTCHAKGTKYTQLDTNKDQIEHEAIRLYP